MLSRGTAWARARYAGFVVSQNFVVVLKLKKDSHRDYLIELTSVKVPIPVIIHPASRRVHVDGDDEDGDLFALEIVERAAVLLIGPG
jgi:hypothetical protein